MGERDRARTALATHYDGAMPPAVPLSPEDVGTVVGSVQQMTLAEQEQLADALHREQPDVLTTTILACKHAETGEARDAMIEIALVVFQCLRDELSAGGPGTEADIERCVERNAQMWRFLDGEHGEAFTHSVSRTVETYPEPSLLAYAVKRLQELNIKEPMVISAVKAMLDVCVNVKWPVKDEVET